MTSPLPTDRSQSGFTLIEIMFAMVVFSVGMLALLMCVPVASKKVMSSGSQTRAASIAAEMAEELLATPYNNSALTAGTHNDPANPHDAIYYTRWVVADNAPIAQCKRVTVTVSRRSVTATPEARIVIITPRSGG